MPQKLHGAGLRRMCGLYVTSVKPPFDPVANGFVTSLARPGGNITGLSVLAPELGGKRLEILKEAVPKLSRVAVVGSSTLPGNAETLRETELVAGALGLKLQFVDVLSPEDIEAAFRRAIEMRADALLVQGSGILNAHRTKVADRAVKTRLPGMYYAKEFVDVGGLMFYGVDSRFAPACSHLRGQDSERRQAGRSPGRATDKV